MMAMEWVARARVPSLVTSEVKTTCPRQALIRSIATGVPIRRHLAARLRSKCSGYPFGDRILFLQYTTIMKMPPTQ